MSDHKLPDLRIDQDALPEQWQQQAALMLHWGLKLADAQAAADEARTALVVVESQIARDVRSDPGSFGVEKLTEGTVAEAVHDTEEYQEAAHDVNATRHEVATLRAVVDAIAHRKSALQGMTDLWLRQYYADPTSREQPAELREGAATAAKRSRRRPRHRGSE